MRDRLFGDEDPRPVALMRIGLGLVLLWDALWRWPFVVELYSADGMPMPLHPGSLFAPPALPALWCVAAYALLLFALAAVTLGWQARISLVMALVLFGWFGLLDMAGSFKKFSVIALHLLVLLPFTRSGAVWSIDAFTDSRTIRGQAPVRSPRWPRFLMGMLVSFIYLGAVITKVRTADFASGDLLMFSLLDERWGGTRLGMWLATQPALLAVMSIGTVFYEFTAALLLWVPQTRRFLLVIGLLFHVSIAATMHVGIFSPIMAVVLCAFLDESDIRAVRAWFRLSHAVAHQPSRSQQQPRPQTAVLVSRILFAGLAAGGVMAGVRQQRRADDFGAFSGRPVTWVDVDPATIDAFSTPACPNVDDFFHRIEIGSRVESFRTFGHRTEFPRGETVYVLARMQQNRPSLMLHWTLLAPDGQPIERIDRPLQHWPTYAGYAYRMTSPQNPTGEYTIVLEASYAESGRIGTPFENGVLIEPNRREVVRKTFRLIEAE